MLRLLGSPRNFPALPALWDGVSVRWLKWETQHRVSHVEHACGQCGIDTSKWHATGLWVEPGARHVHNRGCARDRKHKCGEYINFRAVRCGWCGHTTVYTMHDEQAWVLDETDYGEAGSYDTADADKLF